MKKLLSVLLVTIFALTVFVGYSGTLMAAGTIKQPKNYPNKPITLVVPAGAGAAIDVPTRYLVQYLDLGKPVVIENRAGASQTIGTSYVASKPADGYTLVIGANANFMIQPNLLNLPYKPQDFRHISMITSPDPQVLAVTSKSPFKSFKDLEAKLKTGEEITYTAGNPGSVGHVAVMELFRQMGAKNMKFVPYSGTAQGLTALLGGHIEFMAVDSSEVVSRLKDGIVPLMTLSEERTEGLPDVPCAKEFGYKNMIFVGYKWIAVRKETPDPIVKWLKQQIDEAIMNEKYQAFLMKNTGRPCKLISEKELTNIVFKSLKAYDAALKRIGMKK